MEEDGIDWKNASIATVGSYIPFWLGNTVLSGLYDQACQGNFGDGTSESIKNIFEIVPSFGHDTADSVMALGFGAVKPLCLVGGTILAAVCFPHIYNECKKQFGEPEKETPSHTVHEINAMHPPQPQMLKATR